MALQNFVDYQGPTISAAWLNAVDRVKEKIVGELTGELTLTIGVDLEFYQEDSLIAALNSLGGFRAQGVKATGAGALAGSGEGVELEYDGTTGFVTAYNRDTASYLPLNIRGSVVQVNGQSIRAAEGKIKAATTNRASTITLANDDELAGIPLDIGVYLIEAWLNFANASVAGAGFQHSFSFTGTASGRKSVNGYVNGAALTYPNTQSITSTTQHEDITTLAAGDWIKIEGFLNVTAAGDLALRWSQQTSDAAVTQLYSGSWLRATRMA